MIYSSKGLGLGINFSQYIHLRSYHEEYLGNKQTTTLVFKNKEFNLKKET